MKSYAQNALSPKQPLLNQPADVTQPPLEQPPHSIRQPKPVTASDEPFDNIRHLYVSRQINAVQGVIVTDRANLEATLYGEVLLDGRAEGTTFVAHQLRRLALYGSLVDPGKDERIGVFSLSGPADGSPVQPSTDNLFDTITLQLHYAALTRQHEPVYENEDAVFPRSERINASLQWLQASGFDPPIVFLQLRLNAAGLPSQHLEVIQRIHLEIGSLLFQHAGTGAPRPKPHFTLSSNCPTPALPCAADLGSVTRTLPIKFIDFSTKNVADVTELKDLEDVCQQQIDGVCAVWRNKAALDLDVQGNLEHGTADHKDRFAFCNGADELMLPQPLANVVPPSFDVPERVEVYIVDELLDRGGGGVAHNCGFASAYCIIAMLEARSNPFLLAHELGHILGLDHPDGLDLSPPYPGSPESIMQAATVNPPINTTFNCRIFTITAGGPLNPIVATTVTSDCFRPDVPGPATGGSNDEAPQPPVG